MNRVLKCDEFFITESFADHQRREKGKQHIFGVDIVGAGYTVSDIKAHSDGVVVKVIDYIKGHETDKQGMGFGNQIIIKHDNGYYTIYSHLAPNSIRVKIGMSVKEGQIIAFMGNTGSSTASHLDFSVIKLFEGANINNVNLVTDVDKKFSYENPERFLRFELPKTIYRVQTNAFLFKSNAINHAKTLRSKGYDVCIKKNGLNYRVQVGAYSVYINAVNMLNKVRLEEDCKKAYITSEDGADVSF